MGRVGLRWVIHEMIGFLKLVSGEGVLGEVSVCACTGRNEGVGGRPAVKSKRRDPIGRDCRE